jgi:glycosyltransferase 2 family protein
MRRTVFILGSIVVSAVLLYFAVQGVPLNEIAATIQGANVAWILLAAVTMSAGMWTRGIRWYGLLDFKVPVMRTAHILNIGFMLNFLPLRLGEVARSVLISREGVPFVTAATSVVLERLVDTLLVVILLVIAIQGAPNVSPEIVSALNAFGILSVTAFIVLLFFARYPKIGHQVLATVERFLPFLKRLGIDKIFDNVLDGLKPLTHWRSAIYAIGWTLISWAISFVTVYALVRSLSVADASTGLVMEESRQLLLSLLCLTMASFSVALPATVGGVGPFQIAVNLAGAAVLALPAHYTALGFLFHGVNIIGYAVWGVVGLLAMGVSLSEVFNQKATASTPAPGEA